MTLLNRFTSAPLILAFCTLSACAAPDAPETEPPLSQETVDTAVTSAPAAEAPEALTPAMAEMLPAAPEEAEKTEKAAEPEKAPEKASEAPASPAAAEKTAAPAPKQPPAAKPVQKPKKGSPSASDYVSRQEVREFLAGVAREKHIPYEWLEAEVSVARYSPLSERYTTPKPKANRKTSAEKNFRLYERNLVNDERIERGVEFLADHREVFDRVERETGVSRYVITAIIGVESIYGRNMGRFRVLDALMTLSFDYTRRAAYYRTELADFLEFCWHEKVEPVSISGSFAGAMGLGQFMPTSLKAYGRDGDGDGRIDIVASEADGIASVANFLLAHGWAKGERPLYRVEANDAIFKATGSGGITTHTTAGELFRAGVKPLDIIPLRESEPALLVDLPWVSPGNTRGVDYFLGTASFAAILRYNRSYFYAAAVSFLADEIESRDASRREPAEKTAAPAPSESESAPQPSPAG
ncbi:lytic transglycosylase domain-containing protein [Sutterella sp.]|uniref:lytic murein transglycosylase n=1 Tax=Sutterella sp. TaxID=1981025 RepID=UPI0026E06B7A|nr:lytic murein transglycosylase [Sutterella sp.]MDO5532276.1 lytic murein transglycosylase [Sutterella sp.]